MDEVRVFELKLQSDFCPGNGESVGNSIDTDVVLDDNGLPYIPGRRLKGCLRQSAEFLAQNGYRLPVCGKMADQRLVNRLFGTPEQPGALVISNAYMPHYQALTARLKEMRNKEGMAAWAVPTEVANIFTRVLVQTKIENGVAKDDSLRSTRVISRTIPGTDKAVTFEAEISLNVQDNEICEVLWELTECCVKATRHMGTRRNRGLGLVKCSLGEKEGRHNQQVQIPDCGEVCDGEYVELEYHVLLDSDMMITGPYSKDRIIPARAVIGSMSGTWLKNHGSPDDTFTKLFLDGTVRWSSLTPVIKGKRSLPAPATLLKFKYAKDPKHAYRNAVRLEPGKREDKMSSPGLLFAVTEKDRWTVASVKTVSYYHHRHEKKESPEGRNKQEAILYYQEAIKSDTVYGGTARFPKEMLGAVSELLEKAYFRFGHSKSAQYSATCVVKDSIRKNQIPGGKIKIESDVKTVYVLLLSDLAIQKDALYTTDPDAVREAIIEKFGLNIAELGDGSDSVSENEKDYCRHHEIGGFQSMWGLRKPVIPVVSTGSVFCFRVAAGEYPEEAQIGEFRQEGFGLCRLMEKNEFPDNENIEYTDIMTEDRGETDESDWFYTALLISSAKEVLRKKAEIVFQKYGAAWAKSEMNGMFSRIRTLVQETGRNGGKVEDLKNEISKMDTNATASKKGKTKLADDFFHALYGNGDMISAVASMLDPDAKLAMAVGRDGKAQKYIYDHLWSMPAMLVIHDVYRKRDKEGGDGK